MIKLFYKQHGYNKKVIYNKNKKLINFQFPEEG